MKLRKHRFEVVVGVMIFVVCLLVMLPRLQIAYFGLLDDGGFLVIAKAFRQNLSSILTHESIRGRFRPAFYLYLTFSDLLLGLSPKKYFFLLMILLNTSAGMLFAFLRLKGVHRIAAVFSVLLFVVSAPVFENYYTVFKNEPIMLIWILFALLLGRLVLLSKRNWERILLYVGVVFSTFMAMASKETAAIMPAIYLGWYIISLVKKNYSSTEERKNNGFLFLTSLIALVIYLLLKQYYVPPDQVELQGDARNYQFTLTQFSDQASRWFGLFIRDYPYLLPLAGFLLSRNIRQRISSSLLLEILVWMVGWVAIFLPWHSLLLYYTLPFSIGASILGGLLFWAVWEEITAQKFITKMVVSTGGLFLALLLLMMALINNWMVGQVQIRVDRENWQLLEYLRHIPENSRVLFNTDYNEYVNETRLFLNEIMKRPDISVDIMDYELPYQNLEQKTFIIIPIHNHQLFPAVRIAVNEPEAQAWKMCFDSFQNGQAELVQSNSSELWRPDFGFNRLMPRLGFRDLISAYQEKQYPFFYTSKLKYGWQVYRLSYDPDLMALPGSFRDGIWTFFEPSGSFSSLKFGQAGDVPFVGDWDGDAKSEIGVYRPSKNELLLDTSMDGVADISVVLENGVVGYPVSGDWDGNGSDDPAVLDTSGQWQLYRLVGDEITQWSILQFGAPGDTPLAGDWNGDGLDTPGVYVSSTGQVLFTDESSSQPQPSVAFEIQKELIHIIAADWYGLGKDFLVLVEDDQWLARPVSDLTQCPNSIPPLTLDFAGGVPLGGIWDWEALSGN